MALPFANPGEWRGGGGGGQSVEGVREGDSGGAGCGGGVVVYCIVRNYDTSKLAYHNLV